MFNAATTLWLWKLMLTAECLVLMTFYRLKLQHKRFPELATKLGEERKTSFFIPFIPDSKRIHAMSLKAALRRAVKFSPWHLNCLAQALCAAHLLRRYHVSHALFFGAKRSLNNLAGLEAHAWVMAGQHSICGGFSFEQYTALNCFAYHA
jgi:hypothetical protein